MRYQTELMRAILTNETAQEIIDWVSQLYGESYVGLWVYQVLGIILGEIRAMAEQLRQEVRPSTAELTLDQWEQLYGLTNGSGLTTAQRQARLLERKLRRAPMNPNRLERLVQAMTGCKTEVTENVAPYVFAVRVFYDDAAPGFDIQPVIGKIREVRPAHLSFLLIACLRADQHLRTGCGLVLARWIGVDCAVPEKLLVYLVDENGDVLADEEGARFYDEEE